MNRIRPQSRRRTGTGPGRRTCAPPHRFVPPATILALALVIGSVLIFGALNDTQSPPEPSAEQAFAPPEAGGTASAAPPGVPPLPRAQPVRIRIPAIHVNAPFTKLHLDKAGVLRPPPATDAHLAGWYSEGTAPGSRGTAVTVGHVDTPAGDLGVFYELGTLTKGETIEVGRADHRTAVFTVDAVEAYDKDRFPRKKVYGRSERPELRLITCAGYVRGAGYQRNIVVYATLTGSKKSD
ncbi:class F sortase [Streptomyces adustus]|uniref:class F sortase n=1 Tax=Streptomyces adustus TaxID=1609272 RepID=UPI0035D6F859